MSDVPFLPLLSTVWMAPLLCWALAWNLISKPFVSIARAMKWIPTPSLKQYDLANKVCIVTGSNTGVGKRTAFHLARMGGSVILACRSKERADSAKTELIKELQAAGVKSPKLEAVLVDLSDTNSVRKFAAAFKEKHKRLDILVNNAGLNCSGKSSQGLNLVWSANFLGHFLLTQLLFDTLVATPGARVINLSSVMHQFSGTQWAEAGLRTRSGWESFFGSSNYADSKLAMILFIQELRRRFKQAKCTATSFAVNPGAVASDIWRPLPEFVKPAWNALMWALFLTTDQGSYTSVVTATAPLETLGGPSWNCYFQPYYLPPLLWPHAFEMAGPFIGCARGFPTLPEDPGAEADKLWTECAALIEVAESGKMLDTNSNSSSSSGKTSESADSKKTK